MPTIFVKNTKPNEFAWKTFAQHEQDLKAQIPEASQAAYQGHADAFETAKTKRQHKELPQIVKAWVADKAAAPRALDLDSDAWKFEGPASSCSLALDWEHWHDGKKAADSVVKTLLALQSAPLMAIKIGRAPLFGEVDGVRFGVALGKLGDVKHIDAQGAALEFGTFAHVRPDTVDISGALNTRMTLIEEIINSDCKAARLSDDTKFDAFTKAGYTKLQ